MTELRNVTLENRAERSIEFYFTRGAGPSTTLAAATVLDARVLDLADVTGFIDGTYVCVYDEAAGYYFGTQLGAPKHGAIVLDTPVDREFPSGATVLNLSRDIAVNGSANPIVFQVPPPGVGLDFDVTQLVGIMIGTNRMDDEEFGNLDALNNGCVLRLVNNIWNVKTNGELALLGFDFDYVDIPGAEESARFRISYGGQSSRGVVLRVNGGRVLEFVVQDDLTDLIRFNLMAHGHVIS